MLRGHGRGSSFPRRQANACLSRLSGDGMSIFNCIKGGTDDDSDDEKDNNGIVTDANGTHDINIDLIKTIMKMVLTIMIVGLKLILIVV